MAHSALFHVIWTVRNEFPVWNPRGHWQFLSDCYELLRKQHVDIYFSHDLHPVYGCQTSKTERSILSETQITRLKSDLTTLCEPGKERVLAGLKLESFQIFNLYVSLLVRTNESDLKQQMARLKSRSSSLLQSNFPDSFESGSVWGKGFWYAQLLSKQDYCLEILNTYR